MAHRYEIRARYDPLADYIVLSDTNMLSVAQRLARTYIDMLPHWQVWLFDTKENAVVTATP